MQDLYMKSFLTLASFKQFAFDLNLHFWIAPGMLLLFFSTLYKAGCWSHADEACIALGPHEMFSKGVWQVRRTPSSQHVAMY